MSAHAPAGLVGHHPGGGAHGLANGRVDRLATRGRPQHGVNTATTTEGNTEQAFKAAGDLAMRQSALLVEFDDGGLGIGPQLSRGRTQGVGRLQAMASLHPTAALTALTDVDVELPVNGLAWDLDLELLSDMGFVKQPA